MCGSIASTLWSVAKYDFASGSSGLAPNIRGEVKVKTTSSAVKASPLWNFTPRRSFSTSSCGPLRVHSVARDGTSRLPPPSGEDRKSRRISVSKIE